MSDTTLRIGVIGVGAWAVLDHIPNLRNTGRVKIVAVSRRDPERLAMVQQKLEIPHAFTDWRRMLESVPLDAVVVCTTHDMHTEPVLTALERGLHVLVDKPLALTRRDAHAMVQAAEQSRRVLMVNYQRRGNGLLRAAKQILSEGVIGRIQQVNLALTYYFRWWLQPGSSEETGLIAGAAQLTGLPEVFFSEWARWHTDPARMGGGAFVDTGSHFVDVALWLAGSGTSSAGPQSVVAFSNPPNSRMEQCINVQARLDNGVLFSMTAGDSNTGRIGPGSQRLSIIGEDGVLVGDLDELWLNRRGELTKVEPMAEVRIANAFTSAICDGGPNISPARDAEQVVALTEAAYQSAVEGNIVNMT